MNKKGMTLIEMVVTLLILSIASTMLLGGFATIIRIMGNASEVKNASNTLLSYLEGTDDKDVEKEVDTSSVSTPLTYTIKKSGATSNERTIDVVGTIQTFKTKKEDDIKLTKLGSEKNILVKEKNFYKQLTYNITYLMNVCQREEKKIEGIGFPNTSIPPKLDINELRYANTFDVFPKGLLPGILVDETSYYLLPAYPWDLTKDGEISGESGGKLLFVSNKIQSAKDYDNKEFYINIIYDYNSGRWYFYPYQRYKLTTKKDSSIPQLSHDGDSSFIFNVNNYEKFIEHVKNKSNGWLELNINKKYTNRTDDLWQ